eukprot:2887825-Pyramimonas_sp.AAC.1
MHRLPRRLKGPGTYSEPLQADQGALAGCPHAVCIHEVLVWWALLRLREVHGDLVPRALVDDLSVQYVGYDANGVKALQLTVG